MKNKNTNVNNNSSKSFHHFKNGKILKEFIPSSFQNYRIMNPLYNYEDFTIKKSRDYIPPFEPFDIFPEWPSEEEVEVI